MNKKFEEQLEESRQITLKRLNKELLNAKLMTIKGLLKEKGIIVNENIKDLNELKKYLKNKLKPDERYVIDEVFKNADNALNNVVTELKNGSTNAFSKFLNKLQDIVKPLGKSIINSLAIKTIITLAPTITLKLALSSLILLRSGYKLSKSIKYKNIVNRSYECNRILNELETTKNEYGNIVDTRFDESMIKIIKDFLKRNNIKYNDTGYLSLRECLMNLPIKQKVSLINIINNFKGNKIDINKRLSIYDETLFTKFKKNFLKPITIGAAGGASVATAVNAIEPAITAGIYNGTFLGSILSKLADSKVLGFISSSTTIIGSYFLKYIPIVGPALENFMAYENLFVTSIIGSVLFLGYNTLKLTGKGLINVKDRIKSNREHLTNLKKDAELYYNDNLEELNKKEEYYQLNGPNEDEKAIMILVIRYMDENNIILDRKVNSISDLKNFINSLNRKEKHKINKLLNELESLCKNNYSYFKQYITHVGNMAYLGVTLSLAGLSVIDIIKGGDFLDQISETIFNKPGLVKPIDIEAVKASHEIEITSKEALVAETPKEITPMPCPAPAPLPTPTPAPTPSPSHAEIPDSLSIVAEATKSPSVDYTYDFLNNGQDFINKINISNGEDIFKTLKGLGDIRFINNCTEKIDYEALTKLYEYINNNPSVDPSNLSTQFIIDSLNKRITGINDYILRERNMTDLLANTAGTINVITDNQKGHKK